MARDPQIRAILRAVDRFTEKAVRKITLDVTANLIETTPVDIGWARANWVPSIGASIDRDLEGVRPTPQAVASATVEQQAGIAAVAAGYRLDRGSVFVSNNVDYIGKLNDGSSAQAPAGFIQRAIQKAVTIDIRGLRP